MQYWFSPLGIREVWQQVSGFARKHERVSEVAVAAGKRYDSFRCSISGFVEAGLRGLFSAFLRTVGKADAANCACFERGELSRVLIGPLLLSNVSDFERSCVLSWGHGCYSRMKKVCCVQEQ